VDGAEQPADETDSHKENERQTDEPEDEIEYEMPPPLAHRYRHGRQEEGKNVSH